MKRMGLWIIALLASASSVAQAQSLSFDQTNYRNDASRGVNGKAEFRFALFASGLGVRSAARPFGFSLMAAGSGLTSSRLSLSPMAAGPNLPVLGGGTLGRLTKWTGFTTTNSFIGDSTIFESKGGLVGIGTDSPTSRLTVAGLIQSTTGGFKFPDGSVQTTSASGALFSVIHDATLTGNGTIGSPLGVAVPLILSGSVGSGGIIQATNTAFLGGGIEANAGPRGDGVRAAGGPSSDIGPSGVGVRAFGGLGTDNEIGGTGVVATGGNSIGDIGGAGVSALGGQGFTSNGGTGVFATGGPSESQNGGRGVSAFGGQGEGMGNSGGIGIEATGGTGVLGAIDGLAGKFNGDVEVTGSLNVTGTKNFKIDHPLDPENKYLLHAAIESSEALNVYSGNVMTDERGEAVVTLPDWFEAVNRDFRYQLTVVGTFAQAIVAKKIERNRFVVQTSAPNVEVSWQVAGVRSDAAMKKHPFKTEQEKPERERGTYLDPEAFNQPEARGIEWVRHPESMRQIKQRRIEVEQIHKPNNR